jgi:hypothetical protein
MLIVTSRVRVSLAMLGLTLAVMPAFVSAQQAQRFAEAALFFELPWRLLVTDEPRVRRPIPGDSGVGLHHGRCTVSRGSVP